MFTEHNLFSHNMAKQNVNRILDAFITILEEDRKLPNDDPHKMDRRERMHVMDKIERIQLARGRHRVDLGPQLVFENPVASKRKWKRREQAAQVPHEAPAPADPKADAFLKAVTGV